MHGRIVSKDVLTMPLWLNFLIIFILILVNGFFAAAEMALVSINVHHIKQLALKQHKKAKRVLKLTSDSTKYLSTIQVAITFAGFLSSALAGSNLSGDVVLLFASINITIHQTLAMIIVTILLSFVTLVLGELVPKRLAMYHANSYALFSSSVVNGLMIGFKPFVWLLTKTTEGMLYLFGVKKQTNEEQITEEEIKSFILKGHLQGLYQKEEKDMLNNVFKFDDLKASQVMVPRTKVFALSIHDKQLIQKFIKSHFARVLLYEKSVDEVKGILHIKDVTSYAQKHGFENVDVKKIMQKPTYIPEDMSLRDVFIKLKETNTKFSVLVDEYGGTVGILTMEDLVEEIVGNLYDEHDQYDDAIKTVKPNMYLVRGDVNIQDINRRIGISISESDERFDTLNGLIIALIGKIPAPDDMLTIPYKNIIIKIEKVVDHAVKYAIIEKKDNENG